MTEGSRARMGKSCWPCRPAKKSHLSAFCAFSGKDASSLEEDMAIAVTRHCVKAY